jgi:hypothetical protein
MVTLKPLSVVLIASQESAKTQCLMRFKGTNTLHYLSDVTSKGVDMLKPAIENGDIRHIVILDLVKVLSHGRNVSERTLQTFAGLMEEGQADTADAGGYTKWAKQPNCGLLMAITPEFYTSRRGKWRATGFLTRFLPIHFAYTDDTIMDIHNGIASLKLTEQLPAPLIIPKIPRPVYIKQAYANQVSRWSQQWAKEAATNGFRHHKQLQALVLGSAAARGREEVTTEDMDRLKEWLALFNVTHPMKL